MDKGKSRAHDPPSIVVGSDLSSSSPLSYNQLLDSLHEFLEVAIHTLLCLRGVYPHDVFTRRKKYNHPCYQSRHPGLNEYIARVLRAVRNEVEQSKVDKVVLAIRPTASDDAPHAAYERFTFALSYILPASEIDVRNRNLALSHNVSRKELEIIFRGFMQKLMVVDGALYDLPTALNTHGAASQGEGEGEGELTFAILLEMRDDETPTGQNKDQPAEGDWVFADDENLGRMAQEQERRRRRAEAKRRQREVRTRPESPMEESDEQGHDDEDDDDDSRPTIRPIKTLDTGVINMMLYVEEDLVAKLSQAPSNRRSDSTRAARHGNTTVPTAAMRLLSSKASQLLQTQGQGLRTSKNRAKRLDGERELDQPPVADMDALAAAAAGRGGKAGKRKRARMTLGDTRAAESESETSSESAMSDDGSSADIRDAPGSDVDLR